MAATRAFLVAAGAWLVAGESRSLTGGCQIFKNAACPLEEHNIVDIIRGVDSPQSCQRQCRGNAECHFFTHYETLCYLLISCNALQLCPGCVSGPQLPDADTCEVTGGDCSMFHEGTCNLDEYNIIEFLRDVSSPSQCQNLCRGTAGCTYFTHFGTQCYLLRNCSSKEMCTGCVSGPLQPDFATCSWPPGNVTLTITATCDNFITVYADGIKVLEGNDYRVTYRTTLPYTPLVLAVQCIDAGVTGGIILATDSGRVTDKTWKCEQTASDGWNQAGFDDSSWHYAYEVCPNDPKICSSYGWTQPHPDIPGNAFWIWPTATQNPGAETSYCRTRL